MRKTNAALLAEIDRLEREVARLNTMHSAAFKDSASKEAVINGLKSRLDWHKQMNQRLIDAVVHFAGIKGGAL